MEIIRKYRVKTTATTYSVRVVRLNKSNGVHAYTADYADHTGLTMRVGMWSHHIGSHADHERALENAFMECLMAIKAQDGGPVSYARVPGV